MKKYILILFITVAAITPLLVFRGQIKIAKKETLICSLDAKTRQDNLLKYLKLRKDSLALAEAEKILLVYPDDACALWAKAEIYRRAYKFEDAQELLKRILEKTPGHIPSLICVSYIRYHDNRFPEALKILKQVLRCPNLGEEDEAIVYMLIGTINSRKASQGGLWNKVAYGTRIKGYFERAKAIAPDLPEVRLGLGTYCLLAPKIAGGDLDRAIEELRYAVNLAPDFATPKARLAQAYRQKGNLEKYNFYLKRAKELDPANEVVREIEGRS